MEIGKWRLGATYEEKGINVIQEMFRQKKEE